MQIDVTRADGVVRVLLRGRFNADASPDFCRTLSAGLDCSDRSVVLDLAGVELLTSGPIRLIVLLARLCSGRGVDFAVCGATGQTSRVLTEAGLDCLAGRLPDLAAVDDVPAAGSSARGC